MATYIQRRGDGYLETVDEFETYKEAADPSANYYLSTRPCRAWVENEEVAK